MKKVIKQNKAIKTLSDVMPDADIKLYSFTYNLIKTHQYNSKKIENLRNIINGFNDSIIKAEGYGYLDEKNRITLYRAFLKHLHIDQELLISLILEMFGINYKQRRPKDRAFDILLYLIVFHPNWKGKPNFKLIGDFLAENGIAIKSPEALIKSYKRIIEYKIRNVIDAYKFIGQTLKEHTPPFEILDAYLNSNKPQSNLF